MKYLVLVISLLCSHAFAEVTLLVGASQFTPQGDGIWYQDAFLHQLNMRSPSLALRYDAEHFSVGYMYMGRVTSSALATASDANYNLATKSCVGECWPLSHWYGSGDVQGVFASGVQKIGKWSVEAGAYLYRPTWEMRIPDWLGCRECAPQDLTVNHSVSWRVGPMIGVRYGMGPWSLNLSTWRTWATGDQYPAVYTDWTTNMSIGYSF